VDGRDDGPAASGRFGGGCGIAHVTDDDFDASPPERVGTACVAGQHPHRFAAGRQCPDQECPEGTGAAGDEYHDLAWCCGAAGATREIWASTPPLMPSTGSR